MPNRSISSFVIGTSELISSPDPPFYSRTTPVPASETETSSRNQVPIDLALQGGGAHGAFTWGVLDRFLEEPWLQIDGISGTSAGAMNAAALAYGYLSGGNDGARAALETFWRRVSQAGQLSPIRRGPLDVVLGRWTLDNSPPYV